MRPILYAALLALGLSLAPGTTSAAPIAPAGFEPATEGLVESVDYRPYRHCHRWRGRIWCHGPHYYRYRPYVGVPFIYIGPRYRYRAWRRWR